MSFRFWIRFLKPAIHPFEGFMACIYYFINIILEEVVCNAATEVYYEP